MDKKTEALEMARELVQRFLDCDGISSSDYLDVRATIDEALAQPKTVNQFHPDYADEVINEMTLTSQRQAQRIEELEQEASGQYMTGYEVARSEFQQRIQELEAKLVQQEQEPIGEVVTAGVIRWKDKYPSLGTKLYTTPPQRKPLDIKEIKCIATYCGEHITDEDVIEITRRVEEALGKGDA